jgi:hypothetical protein
MDQRASVMDVLSENSKEESLKSVTQPLRLRIFVQGVCKKKYKYASHKQHFIENSLFCTTRKSFVGTGFAKKIMDILRILCYNGSLVI